MLTETMKKELEAGWLLITFNYIGSEKAFSNLKESAREESIAFEFMDNSKDWERVDE